MKAIVAKKYGPAEVLSIEDVPKPTPKDDEVLVKIKETIVTPTDCYFRQGSPAIVRFSTGLFKPKHVQGVELAGVIEEIGKNVSKFKVGDEIFGTAVTGFGAHAEYKCLKQDGPITTKLPNMGFGESAAICDGGLTSYTFLKEVAKIKEGQKLLIIGASGSVGTFGVQLGKHFGAEVTGVCSGKNEELVRSLGANDVIDYTKERLSERNEKYDVIFDTVGKNEMNEIKGLLKDEGMIMSTVFGFGTIFQSLLTSGSKRKVKFAATNHNQENLVLLKELAAEGVIKSVIDRKFKMEEIIEAHKYVETGHKIGNIIITIDE
jgi:NADPH:quinone reductase-like Zn-dependent oxidoreductase